MTPQAQDRALVDVCYARIGGGHTRPGRTWLNDLSETADALTHRLDEVERLHALLRRAMPQHYLAECIECSIELAPCRTLALIADIEATLTGAKP